MIINYILERIDNCFFGKSIDVNYYVENRIFMCMGSFGCFFGNRSWNNRFNKWVVYYDYK